MTPSSSARKLTRRAMLKATAAAGGGLMLGVSIPRLGAAFAAEPDADFAPNAFVRIDRRQQSHASRSRRSRWGRASTRPSP